MTYISPFNRWNDFKKEFSELIIDSGAFPELNIGQIQKKDTSLVSFNLKAHTMGVTANTESNFAIDCCSHEVMLTAAEGTRPFYIKIPIRVLDTFSTTTMYESELLILCCANIQLGGEISVVSPDPPNPDCIRNMWWKEPPYNYVSADVGEFRGLETSPTFICSSDWLTRDYITYRVAVANNIDPDKIEDIRNKFETIFNGITYGNGGFKAWRFRNASDPGVESFSRSYQIQDGRGSLISYEKLPFPLFDYTQVNDIVKYINTGDARGAIDPFDHTPRINPITDYKTNFDMYISANNKSNNKYTIVAVNNEYNQNREELQGLYELKASTSIPFDVDSALNPSHAQVPTITFNKNVNNRDEVSFYFGDVGYTANYSGCFQVTLIKDPTSAVNVRINSVYWSDYPGDEGAIVIGYPITDGYEFTASSGETLRIYFRSISLDDIKDIVDDTYPSKDDDNDDKTGSDVIPLYGSGLRTYILSEGAFDQVNKALWNTDWSTVFKTTTIDPIKCVISCKRIPFTVSGTSSDTIYLANRDIAASTAFISPVKKFRIGSYTIPAIYGNFVDITMTKIHVYLPYIGWKELPAPEVMSRVGRAQVGLQSKTYNLTFDYIVDFVDGNVRCIVAVNGTERWYFDGNCSIDVPVTSDNHTTAVSTAIKSGVATVMSVGSTIGGMWSGNALAVGAGMMGTIQNAMNVVPTYEYSATGSPSGYIDATMNKHIMLIIEYPNAFYPSGYSHKVGLPCMLNLSLGSCSGFTRTVNVDTRGINCTADESDMIKNLLNAGVYL